MDQTITVRNKKTGEVRNVSVTQARQMGFDDAFILSKLKGTAELNTALENPESLTSPEVAKDPFAAQKKSALAAVDVLEQNYGRGKPGKVGSGEDLSLSETGTFMDRLKANVKNKIAQISDPKLKEDLNIYDSALKNVIGVFSQAFGSGTPQEGEAQRLIGSAPNLKSSNKEAKAWFKNVRAFLGEVEKEQPEISKVLNPTQQPQRQEQETVSQNFMDNLVPQQTQQPQQGFDLLSFLGKSAPKAADAAPTVGAVGGGLIGSILGPLGGVGGAAAGYAAGDTIKNNVRNLLGTQDKDPLKQVQDMTSGAAKEAALSTLGLGAGFALKAVAKSGKLVLQSVGKQIDDIPLRSIRVNPSQISNFIKKHGEDMGEFMVKRGYLGEDAIELAGKDATKFQQSYDDLVLRDDIKIPLKTLGKRFGDEITKLGGGDDKLVPSINKNIANKILKEWNSITDQAGRRGIEEITPRQLTELRRMIDDVIPPSAFVNPSVKNTHLRLRKIYNDVVSDAVDSRLIGAEGVKGSIKDLGRELSRLYDFLEVAEKQEGLGRGNLVANITRIMSAGGGGTLGAVLGGIPGAVAGGTAGLAAESSLRNPNVLKHLFKGGQAVKSVGQSIDPTLRKILQATPQVSATSTQLLGRLLGIQR